MRWSDTLILLLTLAGCEGFEGEAASVSPYSSCRLQLRGDSGSPSSSWTHRFYKRYNAAGHLVYEEQDWSGDGLIDEFAEGEHDERGRLVRLVRWSVGWWGGDGEEDYTGYWQPWSADLYTWNGANQLDEHGVDYDLDGLADTRTEYINSFLGPLEARIDHNASGTMDSLDTYRYNRHGQLERIDHDAGHDGAIDSSLWYEYRDHEISVLARNKVHGAMLHVTRTVYDDSGREVLREVDWGLDYVVDERWTYDWTCPP